ncbi:MAG: glycoside hydrolase family 31 protein [Clostridia bacterium]|nr:glycoside hydrolase family 31 protein [Clostridia bacterium]
MERITVSPVLTELRFGAEEDQLQSPIIFSAGSTPFLRLESSVFTPCPVFRTDDGETAAETVMTANGEVTVKAGGTLRPVRMTRRAELTFSYSGHPLLTGLGQHEYGIEDYAARTEYLYPHNMKIPVPFLLASDGWGVWIRADCAMRYEPFASGFRFVLEAADKFSIFVFGPDTCAGILKTFIRMNGAPRMLPRWVFGYLQSKERYHSSEELLDTVHRFRELSLPLDCIVLDWLSWEEGCWGDKKPDPVRFPDIRALTDELHSAGVRLMVSVWPNMTKGHDCDEFASRGMFLPGTQIYDAFSEDARDLYWKQCRRYWMDGGTDALWCDSSEPIIDPDWCGNELRPEDERCRLLTSASSVCMDPARMNAYGSVHTSGISARWLNDYPDKRPVILSRSGGPDSAASGVILWSGDICARWDVLRAQVAEGIRAAESGLVYWTLDIGAFFVGRNDQWFWRGDYPQGADDPGYRELYVRWFQYGAMLPVFRSHGTDTPREPWRFGDESSLAFRSLKETLALRYRLLPYIYSTAWQCRQDCLPMVRSMLIACGSTNAARCRGSYMFGDALLVHPVTAPLSEGGNKTDVELPEGCLWYDLFSRQIYKGGRRVAIDTPLDRFPLFAAAGSILPLADPVLCTDELSAPADRLEIFAGRDGSFTLYADKGNGNGYMRGEYCLIPITWNDDEKLLRMDASEGGMRCVFPLKIVLHLPDGTIEEQSARYVPEGMTVRFD